MHHIPDVLRRGGSQTRPPPLYPLVPVGEGLAPSRRVCTVPFDLRRFRRLWAASGFLSDQKATKESPGDGSGEHQVVLLVARPPGPMYGRAWYGNLAQMYRRGVPSDAPLFSRPLPLCGKTGGPSVLPV